MGLEVVSRGHWSGTASPEEESERERFHALAEKAPGRAKRICDYALFGPDMIDMSHDGHLAEVMDQLRTDEDVSDVFPSRPRKSSSEIIREWVRLATKAEC